MTCPIEILSLIYKIAKDFSIIIASAIAFFGVKIQLEQNREWKAKEHAINLKKKEYLESITAIHQLISSLVIHGGNGDTVDQSPILRMLFLADNKLREALMNFKGEYERVLADFIKNQHLSPAERLPKVNNLRKIYAERIELFARAELGFKLDTDTSGRLNNDIENQNEIIQGLKK